MSVTLGFNIEELYEEKRTDAKKIDQIKRWLEAENLPVLVEEQIALFLLSCDNETESTKKTVKAYFEGTKNAPELFDYRSVTTEELQKQLQVVEFSVFPKRTQKGEVVVFHRLRDTTFMKYDMELSMKLLFMTLDLALFNSPPEGLIILFDMKGVGLLHLTRVRLDLVRKFFHYTQQALRVKLRAIHVLNTVYFLDKVMSIIKPFIKKEVLDLVRFHGTKIDMNDFYVEHIPKECLPLDFGGLLPPIEELHEKNIGELKEIQHYFDKEERQRHKL